MTTNMEKLPRWDLTNVFPGLDSVEFREAFKNTKLMISNLEHFISENDISGKAAQEKNLDMSKMRAHLISLIDHFNLSFRSLMTLRNYVSSYTSTDSYNSQAMRLRSEIQSEIVRLAQSEVKFHQWLGSLGMDFAERGKTDQSIKDHAYYLQHSAEQSRYLMSEREESLAADLSLSGIRAWGKLHGIITSQMTIDCNLNNKTNSIPLPVVQNIRRYHPDESIRRKAFEGEIAALEEVREPLAACLNGVKGFVNTINFHRGRESALLESIDQYHIDQITFNAMMTAIEASLPTFRKYLKAKAHRFQKGSLPWWDLFAPVNESSPTFTWENSQRFIVENFSTFSTELASFAQRAFDNNWIDAEPRPGKRGGAFCMRIPSVEEPRILCNFDGSLGQVSTIAHELGHGFHIDCQSGKNYLQYQTPMTLAETASIFCQTIIQDAALKAAKSKEEELYILETSLINITQVIVDITSRFFFEKEVFERRKKAELSADDFCEIITDAQKATYGSGLDENHLHPYMWAWKPHYYREDISFYNYPYAFGLLFSIGLYAIYQQRGKAFINDFKELLANTGMANAIDLAANFDIDIRSQGFWDKSLSIIEKRIDRYLIL